MNARRERIEALHREGQAAWPGIEVDLARFGDELERRCAAAEIEPSAVRVADVYLAVACLLEHPRAVAIVRDILGEEVRFAANRTRATADQLAEVTAALTEQVLVGEPDRSPALHDYAGRGDLRSYLRVIATRKLFRVVNRGRREVGLAEDLVGQILPASSIELAAMRARYGEAVAAAIRHTVDALDVRHRALLRYAYIDGWNVDRVGELYDVHRATAARWIAAARDALSTGLRTRLATVLAIEHDEVDSIVRLVQSRIDVSLERILQD